ncbi:hypothetical protein D3C72_1366310 [compost metagenome]
MLLHALAAFGLQRLGIEQADDAVAIAHRGDFRIGDNDGHVCMAHGQRRTAFDTGRAVADHPVEMFLQLVDDPFDAFRRQIVLVTRLRGRQEEQRLEALVADQRLRQLGVALDDVDEIVNHAAFSTHDEIEVTQTDIEIDDHDLLFVLRQCGAKRCGRGGLADPALAGSYNDYLPHMALSCSCVFICYQPSFAALIVSFSSQS